MITIVNTGENDMEVMIPTWRCGVEDGQKLEKVMETWKEFFNCGRTTIEQESGYVTVHIKAGHSLVYHSI